MKLSLILVVAALAIGSVSPAIAQQGGGGQRRGGFGRGMMGPTGPSNSYRLLNRTDVQDDLKLTSDQKTKIEDINTATRDKMREVFQSSGGDRQKAMDAMKPIMEDTKKQLEAVLTSDQTKRLKEISIQLGGTSAVLDPEVQSDLKLTDDQKSKIKDLQDKQQAATTELMQKVQNNEIDRSQVGEIMKKNTDTMNAELEKILTSDQKDQLKKMGGEPFKATEQPRGFGGGGRRGGGGGGGAAGGGGR